MALNLAGPVVGLLGVMAISRPASFTIKCFFVLTIFATAAAINAGGASITAANFFLVFALLRLALLPQPLATAKGLLGFNTPGFWLLIAFGYGVLGAIFLPRLFPGITDVYALGRTAGRLGASATLPFGPSAAHITQSIYAIGGLLAFLVSAILLRRTDATETVIGAMKITGIGIIVLSALDLVSFYAHVPGLLDPIRTASYNILNYGSASGLKRIIAGYPEASIFVLNASMAYAFAFHMWLCKVESRVFGPIALLLLGFILLSTSSTAYIVIVVHACIIMVRMLIRMATGRPPERVIFLIIGGYLALLGALLILRFSSDTVQSVQEFFNGALFEKAASESGRERLRLSQQALVNFRETWLLGVGIGGARASGYGSVLLSNIGLLGTGAYLMFVWRMVRRGGRRVAGDERSYRAAQASKIAVVTGLVSAIVSLSVFDIGMLYYLLAAAATVLAVPFSQARSAPTRTVRVMSGGGEPAPKWTSMRP